MPFEYDPYKRVKNLLKHGFDLNDASAVFAGKVMRFSARRGRDGEWRGKVVGRLNGEIVTVIVTLRWPNIRVISMRKPHDDEEAAYIEKFGS